MSAFTVTEAAMRPGGRDGGRARECFYCKQHVGTAHKPECVLVQRRVIVRLEAKRVNVVHEYEVSVPAHWDAHDIEFHRNDSSWCAGNALDEVPEDVGDALAEMLPDDPEDKSGCLCADIIFTYVRDAEGERGKPYLSE